MKNKEKLYCKDKGVKEIVEKWKNSYENIKEKQYGSILEKNSKNIFIQKFNFIVICCFFVLLGLFSNSQKISASSYTNAYTFYEQHGSTMKFVPSTSTDGNIYYATKGKKGYNVSTLYSTIGWKVSVKHNNGTVLQTLYFKLGGSYMQTIHTKEVSGYEYSLYSVRLSSIRNRMNSKSKKALEQGKCMLIFDACIAVKKRGVLQGAMNDNGVTSGTVHMTYNGIVKAAPWSSATKTALKAYYNRSVEGLFSNLTLQKDEGIAWVKGDGTYCYGTTISIEAMTIEGYTFAGWTGSKNCPDAKSTIIMGIRDISLKATSKLSNLMVTYFRNTNASDTKTEHQTLIYGGNPQKLQDFGWKMAGYHQTGWALKRSTPKADYAITNSVSNNWILKHLPKVNLYAVWAVNQYKLIFDANGGSGTMSPINCNYTSKVTLPQNKFTYQTGIFLGWSIGEPKLTPDYTANQTIPVKELAEKMGVLYSNYAEMKLYAVWDNMPTIVAEDIYVSLQDAKAGKITEQFLASYAKATDMEDGEIQFGSQGKNSFLLENYDKSKFLNLEKEAQVKLTFVAKDSSGNICRREITVFVVDTDLYKEKEIIGKVRFISKKYYKKENGTFITEKNGGLMEDSIWKTDVYQKVLDMLFQ